VARTSIRRVYELDRMIRLGLLESTEQAARDLETSRRTVERDLQLLRQDLGAELRYDRAKGRYEYAGEKPFTLPAQWLTEHELAIILIAERALRVFTDTSFHDEVHPTFNRLLGPIRNEKKRLEYIHDLCNSVHFHRPVQPLRSIRHEFSTVLDAIMNRRRLSILYRSARTGKAEERQLEPYVLINDGGEWYVVGRCLRSREERKFVLSQMSNPALLDMRFSIPKQFSVRRFLGQGFGRMRGDEPVQVKLRIAAPASSWVGRSKWHPTQRISKARDDIITLSMKCPLTDSLVRWILQMGECVEVLGPKELRGMVVEKARVLVGKNRA
jgi:predicted DNA-binding transcriptional regulator YafY